MKLTERAHQAWIGTRRVDVLCSHLCPLLPAGARVLDVGCGDGVLAARIRDARSDVEISGIDVLVRAEARIPVAAFDGSTLPYPGRSFDATLLVNVLHHADDPEALLGEAVRVSRSWVILADHVLRGPLSRVILRFMDDVGNRRFGVALPYDYLSETRWQAAFERLELGVETWVPRLGLYPPLLDSVFGGSLHFVARLVVKP